MLLNALDDAFKLLDLREPFGDAFYASVPAAHAALQTGIEKAGAPMDVSIVATGHAHIDVAWMWTLGQTRRKAGRTFHTVLRLMEQFPDYHFTQSQPQLYDYVRQDYPELFEQIGKRIDEGRWETIGGMWVEADCNLSGPESLARQFLLGRTFFREHFGATWTRPCSGCRTSSATPGTCRSSSRRPAWSTSSPSRSAGASTTACPTTASGGRGWTAPRCSPTSAPRPTTAPTPAPTTPMASPKQALGTWTNFQQKELQHELLMAFGYGDGGGGPTREMLENIREMGRFPGAPQMRQASVKEFFQNLERDSGDRLPTWNGELYLELHRGTYTTQSRNKRANRKSEFLLHDAEFVATLAVAAVDATTSTRRTTSTSAWELVCLNQFHDIIPGSSITPVYVESQEQYAEVRALGESVRDDALAAIGRATGRPTSCVANPTGFAQQRPVLSARRLARRSRPAERRRRSPCAVQQGAGGVWIDCGELAPYSVTPLAVTGSAGDAQPERPVASRIRTWRTTSCASSSTSAATSCASTTRPPQREILPEGAIANQFQAFEDRPMNWDAWDVDIFYDDKMWTADPAQSVHVIEHGPLRATLEIRRRILNSDYVQRISLAHNSPRLDFDTTIDWRERHILLKVAFPVDVLTPAATYEIQWGNVQRPTHRNTSWDWARFETARAEVGRPERRRLRRQPAQRLQVRPRHPRQRHAHQPAAQPHHARSRGRPGRAPLRLQHAAARGRVGRAHHRRGLCAQRPAAGRAHGRRMPAHPRRPSASSRSIHPTW